MAISKCAKCASTIFEQVDVRVKGADRKLAFVQCGQCGAVVGVLEQDEGEQDPKAGASRRRQGGPVG